MDGLSISCIMLGITVIALHCIGATFLFKTNRNFNENIELFTLSSSSVVLYILFIAGTIYGTFYPEYYFLRSQSELEKLPKAASILVSFIYISMIPIYTAMISLTLQRFFAIWLHLRYETSWIFLNRTKIIIASLLLVILTLIAAISIIYTFGIDSLAWKIAIRFIPAIGMVATNLTFFSVYIYIYIKLKQARQQHTYGNQNKAKFFAPIIICGSFFVFGTLPYFFNHLMTDVRYIYLGVYVDGITNSIVFIFLNEKVVNRIRRWNNNVLHDSTV